MEITSSGWTQTRCGLVFVLKDIQRSEQQVLFVVAVQFC